VSVQHRIAAQILKVLCAMYTGKIEKLANLGRAARKGEQDRI
jgi:hypothetical protein